VALPALLINWLARLLQPHVRSQLLGSLARAVNYPVFFEVIFSKQVIVLSQLNFRAPSLQFHLHL